MEDFYVSIDFYICRSIYLQTYYNLYWNRAGHYILMETITDDVLCEKIKILSSEFWFWGMKSIRYKTKSLVAITISTDCFNIAIFPRVQCNQQQIEFNYLHNVIFPYTYFVVPIIDLFKLIHFHKLAWEDIS